MKTSDRWKLESYICSLTMSETFRLGHGPMEILLAIWSRLLHDDQLNNCHQEDCAPFLQTHRDASQKLELFFQTHSPSATTVQSKMILLLQMLQQIDGRWYSDEEFMRDILYHTIMFDHADIVQFICERSLIINHCLFYPKTDGVNSLFRLICEKGRFELLHILASCPYVQIGSIAETHRDETIRALESCVQNGRLRIFRSLLEPPLSILSEEKTFDRGILAHIQQLVLRYGLTDFFSILIDLTLFRSDLLSMKGLANIYLAGHVSIIHYLLLNVRLHDYQFDDSKKHTSLLRFIRRCVKEDDDVTFVSLMRCFQSVETRKKIVDAANKSIPSFPSFFVSVCISNELDQCSL